MPVDPADAPEAARDLLLREVRLVPVGPGAAATAAGARHPVDVRVRAGRVTEVAGRLARLAGEAVVEGGGAWAMPGLWDSHVHLGQWSRTFERLDLSRTTSAADALDVLRAHLAPLTGARDRAVVGFGFPASRWPDRPTRSAIDDVARGQAVVLISADVHAGWLSTRASELLGAPGAHDDDGLVREAEWFAVLARLAELPGPDPTAGYRRALDRAAARGVVGVVDMEWEPGPARWPQRVAAGLDALRVRTALYPEHLAAALDAGWRTGEQLTGGRGLVATGPLKIISDGSLNTATAHTHHPYPAPVEACEPCGVQNVAPAELVELCRRARTGGLSVAVHAIGDAAVGIALDALGATGARGTIEHAQLLAPGDAARFARLGTGASVQPAHLLDDRDVAELRWPGRGGDVLALRDLLAAGVRLTFGSDAPVASLDPWLAMAAAVHRSGDDRAPWHPEQQLSTGEALVASTDGQSTLAPGSRGDIALLGADPHALPAGAPSEERGAHLRAMPVLATVLAGRLTHRDC